ncbi:MAG: Smr/MutS family protein [Aureispira sp.]
MFEIGNQIRFKYTGLEAEILEDHQDGTYTVWLMEEADEGIAFEEDIILSKNFKGIQKSAQQMELPKKTTKKDSGPSTEDLFFSKTEQYARKIEALQPSNNKYIQPKKKKVVNSTSESFTPESLIDSPPQGLGCYLAFHQTAQDHYTIYLVNDTPVSFSFKFQLHLHQQLEHGFNKIIPASSYFPIGEFWQAQFNDAPQIEFSCPNFNFKKRFKLKYKKFLSNKGPVPMLGINTYNYLLFTQLNTSSNASVSIKDYTLQQRFVSSQPNSAYRRANLMDMASFNPELDLHAERLVNDTSEFTSGELFEIQLRALETFITQATELELEEVFVIHGLGKGKLREAVEKHLRYHGDIKTYKNEFHEKYGFGATKVTFKR